MPWLIAIIFAYFLLSIVVLGDKYFLTGPLNAKTYTFYAGILGIAVLLLIPLVNFRLPDTFLLFICFLTGFIFISAIFIFYKALENFEVSRIVPAVGGLLPIFTFLLSYFCFADKIFLNAKTLLAFLLLVSGTFLITKKKEVKISLASFKVSLICAFLFSVYFVLSKYLYMMLPFWNALILIRAGAFVVALFFVFTPEVKKEIFAPKPLFKNPKTSILFLANQSFAAGGVILQNWAIALASVSYLAFINALEGIRYVFVFLLAFFLSKKFPDIIKEEISRKNTGQKITAILLIVSGLATLAF